MRVVERNVVVAACQFSPKREETVWNCDVALQLMFEAASAGANVIVLPELCTSGHSFRSVESASRVASVKGGEFSEDVADEIASKFDCYVVFGYVELDGGKLYNSAVVVGPGGVVANSRKRNLTGRDFLWATPGESLFPIVNTQWGRVGVLVGRDSLNRHSSSNSFSRRIDPFYSKSSVDIVAVPCNSTFTDDSWPQASWISLARDTKTNVVVSNRTGKDVEVEFNGGSIIVDRNGIVTTDGSSFYDNAVVWGIVS